MAGSFPKKFIFLPHERHAAAGSTISAITGLYPARITRGEMRASNYGKSLKSRDVVLRLQIRTQRLMSAFRRSGRDVCWWRFATVSAVQESQESRGKRKSPAKPQTVDFDPTRTSGEVRWCA